MVQNVAIPIPSINYADAEIEIDSFKEIPLTAMSANTRRQLSGLLNSRKYLHSEGGYYRDWRGIAALTQDRYYFDESAISGNDPTSRVLEEWCKCKPKDATFANLQKLLGLIDRWDASDDIYENLVEDARKFKAKQNRIGSTANTQTAQTPSIILPVENDSGILTVDDKKLAVLGQQPQIYDAFVLYADVDATHAAEIKRRLEEDNKNNFKLCFKDDLLAGETFVHVALTQLIEQRCNRLIVIFTKEFRKSPENEFLVDYTHAVQIQHDKRKIIPLIYDEDVELPRTLKYVTHLKCNAINYWERLAASIRIVPTTAITTVDAAISPSIKEPNSSVTAQSLDVPSTPSLSIEIPSINITLVPDENRASPTKEARSFKKNTTSRTTNNNNHLANGNAHHLHNSESLSSKTTNAKGLAIRHAHSTSQLNGKNYKENNVSSSDVSISSHCSDTRKKKKKKWPSKFIKKVFSRSSNKLQAAV